MIKQTIPLVILCVIWLSPNSATAENPLSIYKRTYIQNVHASSEEEHTHTKGQISIKYRPFKAEVIPLFVALTHSFWWDTKGKSMEITESNYSIEHFAQGVPSWLKKYNLIDKIQLGVNHTSNGKKGPDSRSTDFTFLSVGFHAGERLRIGGEITGISYFDNSIKNGDIKDYTGNGIYEIYVAGRTKNCGEITRLSYQIKLGDNRSLSRGQQAIEFSVKPLPNLLNPSVFVRYEKGYGFNGLVDYNHMHESVVWGISL